MRKLRRIREKKALSLRKLAQLSGVDYSTISKIETGESRSPRLDTLVRLAQALGVDMSELIDLKELLATK